MVYLLACSKGSANQYKGIIDCVQTIVREEGPPALLKVSSEKHGSWYDHISWLLTYAVYCCVYLRALGQEFCG